MFSLSQTTGYAILALGCIESGQGHRVLSGQIHKCTGVPMPYLRKVLCLLGRAGLIQTKRGYQGGFVLARPADEVSLMDVIKALVHDKPLPDCLLGLPGCCQATPCPMRSFWQEERAKIEEQLRRITVAKAAEFVRAARWGKLCRPPGAAGGSAEPKQGTRPTRKREGSPTARRKRSRAARRNAS